MHISRASLCSHTFYYRSLCFIHISIYSVLSSLGPLSKTNLTFSHLVSRGHCGLGEMGSSTECFYKVNCLQSMFIFSSGTCSKASPCSAPPSSPLSSPASLFSFHLCPRISAPGPKHHLQLPPNTGLPQSLLLADLATLWVWHILHSAFPNGWPLASPNCIFVNQCYFL